MNHKTILSWIKDRLNPLYDHTRCPACMHVVNVDGNGNMEEHGSGALPCIGSNENDELLAEKLDREERLSVATREVKSDGQATH
jgi:hypothetical protein